MNLILMIHRMHLDLLNGGGIKEVSGPFYIALGTVSIMAIYSSFAMNSELIISLIDQLENTVNIRTEFYFI